MVALPRKRKMCSSAQEEARGRSKRLRRRAATGVWNNPSVPLAASAHASWFLVACAAGTVVLLLVLIARVRLHPALGLMIAGLTLGVASGMPLQQVPVSFTAGVGGLMGRIAIVLGLGAILGRLLASSGGAAALGNALVDRCGPKGLPWAFVALGILVGLPVFFEVGLVLLMPIVAAAARRNHRPPILVGLPLLAGLSIVHGTLPPHPAAMLAVAQYHADMGRTILWGLAAGLPAAALAGPVLGWFLIRRWERRTKKLPDIEEGTALFDAPAETTRPEEAASGDSARPAAQESWHETGKDPSAGRSDSRRRGHSAASCADLPGQLGRRAGAPGSVVNQILHFIGSPDIALLIAVLAALVTLGRAHPDRPASRAGAAAQADGRVLRADRQGAGDSGRGGGLERRAAGLGRGAGDREPGAGRAHAAAGAGLAAGRGGAGFNGFGNGGDGGGISDPGAPGRPRSACGPSCWCWPPAPAR